MMNNKDENKSSARRHHFIPQSLLREFGTTESQGKRIWVYDKASLDGVKSFRTSVANVACEGDFHSLERDDGSKDHDAIEQMLSPIETHQIEWIKRIVLQKTIDEAEFGEAAALFSTYRARTPEFKEHIRKTHEEALRVVGDKVIRPGEIPFPEEFSDELKAQILREGSSFFKFNIFNRLLVGMMLKTAFDEKVIEKLGQLDFCLGLVESPEDYLVLPDRPVTSAAIGAPKGSIVELGPGSPFAEFCLPITSRACLIAQWKDLPRSINLDSHRVREINRRSCAMASRFIFSPCESPEIRKTLERSPQEAVGMQLKKFPFPGGSYLLQYTEPIRSGFKLIS